MKNIPLCRSCFFLFLLLISSNALSMKGRLHPFNCEDKSVSPELVERKKQGAYSLAETSPNEPRSTDGKLPSEKTTTVDSTSNDEFGVFNSVPSRPPTPLHGRISPKEGAFAGLEGAFAGLSMEVHGIGVREVASKTGPKLLIGLPGEEGLKKEDVKSSEEFVAHTLSRAASFPITRRSGELPTTPLISPPKKSLRITLEEGSISKLGLNEPATYVEQIIATAVEKNKAALAAANLNDQTLTEAALSVKQKEFTRLAGLWGKVEEVSSLLREETDQLRELRREIERSPSLLQSQSEIRIDQASFEKKRLAQNEIDLLTNTIVAHEKMVNFLFRGTTIIDEWIHDLWTNHLIFAVSSSSDAPVNDLGMMEVEKENCYKNGVSILQILAANHSEDEDQEIASFFARVADSEYDNMQNIFLENPERRDRIIENNKSILAFCSTVNSLQEKIRDNKDLALQAPEERAVILYQEAVQWHGKHCHLIMIMVEQLRLGNEVDLASSENRSKIFNDLASGAEAQARRMEQLAAEEGSLCFDARIVNETSVGRD